MSLRILHNFRFSPLITLAACGLAGLMLKASFWQWDRYQYKLDLLESYQQNSRGEAVEFPAHLKPDQINGLLHGRVRLSGEYDFEQQILIANRKHPSGPGYWLMTPLRRQGTEKAVFVSRGFIPFADRSAESWTKYSFTKSEQLDAIVQETVPHRIFLAPESSTAGSDAERKEIWLYPDLEQIAAQLPYPIETSVFLQRLGGPPHGQFPAESVSVRVPPSTHFGYTIEWALLALSSLVIGFLLQAFPRRKEKRFLQNNKPVLTASILLIISLPQFSFATEQAKQVPAKAQIIERLNSEIDLELEFKDELDNSLSLRELLDDGIPLIIAPVYYECPRLCSLTQQGLLEAINKLDLQLGKEFRTASVSFAPEETAEQAKKKAEKYRALIRRNGHDPEQWRFLRGSVGNIERLMGQLGFSYEKDKGEYIHAAVLLVITPKGRISRYLYGVKYPASDLKLALLEAGEGKIGSTLQRVLLYCFRYDHLQGKYTPAILKITRLLCGGFFVILMSFLLILRFRE